MGYTVFITEKPSVAQEYKKALGLSNIQTADGSFKGYSAELKRDVVVTWAVGHLVAIASPEDQNSEWKSWNLSNLPMIPKNWKYGLNKDTYKQFQVIKGIYKDSDCDAIYYAGDSGREGIYIQALIRNSVFGNGTVEKAKVPSSIEERVVWIDSYTKDAILKGVREAKPYNSYKNMIASAYKRAESDWLIGMNYTRAYTKVNGGYNTPIKVGRVMTPTLNLVVERQKEIDAFVKTDYYGIKTNFASWKADKNSRYYESPLLYNENGFLKKADAEKLIAELEKDMTLTVSDVKTQEKTEYAPYQFNLADLQNYCSKAFHINPTQTLSVAQSLYEKKMTTYPRTDSRFLTKAVQKDLKSRFGYDIPDRYVDDSKVTDHYAIIPTFEGNASLTDLEEKVYNVIKGRFEDMLKPPYLYTAVSVVYEHSNKEHFFEGFRIVRQQGFKKEKDNEAKTKPVPKKGDTVKVDAYNCNPMETKPPAAYTTGTLIMAMEKAGKFIEDEELREQIKTCGIGTSATRAGIIEKLSQGFMDIDKSQKITPTDFGKKVVEIIGRVDSDFLSPVRTAELEQKLSDIADGRLDPDDYEKELDKTLHETIEKIKEGGGERLYSNMRSEPEHTYDCPCCNKTLKYGRYGWYCDKKESGCGFSLSLEIMGAKITEKDLQDLIEKGKTSTSHKMKSPKGNIFNAYLVLNKADCKCDFEFDDTKNFHKKNYNKGRT